MLILDLALVVVELLAIFLIFNLIKVAKHIWDHYSHLAVENAGWFIIIEEKATYWLFLSYFITVKKGASAQ